MRPLIPLIPLRKPDQRSLIRGQESPKSEARLRMFHSSGWPSRGADKFDPPRNDRLPSKIIESLRAIP